MELPVSFLSSRHTVVFSFTVKASFSQMTKERITYVQAAKTSSDIPEVVWDEKVVSGQIIHLPMQETPVPTLVWEGRSPEVGNDKQFQYSCLKNSIDRGAWRATVHDRIAESHRTETDRLKWSPRSLKSSKRAGPSGSTLLSLAVQRGS